MNVWSSEDRLGHLLLSIITRETIEGFQAKRKLDGVSIHTDQVRLGDSDAHASRDIEQSTGVGR